MRIIFLFTNSSAPKQPSSRPEPERLMAAERQLGAVSEHDVHEHHAGLDAVGDAERLLLVGCVGS
jgi:hypothetical protein